MRCFLALPPADPAAAKLRQALDEWRRAEPAIRWEAPAALHLTLQFIGTWPDERTGDIVASLAGWRWPMFTLEMAGIGGFPNLHRPRAVWAGVQPSTALTALVTGIAARLAPLGIKHEARPFTPHVSLARVRSGQHLERWVRGVQAAAPVWGACPASSFCLYETAPNTPAAERYRILHRFPAA